jgi:YjbE family integral membrane protein
MIGLLSAIASIFLVDIVLSGDNALVIGAAAARLPKKQRRAAILAGGAGAVILRVALTFLASFLLTLPWLQAIGGVILLLIAIRLLLDRYQQRRALILQRDEPQEQASNVSRSFISALIVIMVADVTMSLDNVLAVGGLSHGNLLALSIGLLLSIAVLMIGSAIVARLMSWLPWLLDVAALVLAWTGASMVLNDILLGDILNDYAWTSVGVPVIALGIVLIADLYLLIRAHRLASSSSLR